MQAGSYTDFTRLCWPAVPMALGLRAFGRPKNPVWPDDEAGQLWQALSGLEDKRDVRTSWPVTVGEICGDMSANPPDSLHTSGFNGILASYCAEKSRFRPFRLGLDLGAYPYERHYPLGIPFETFDQGWGSERVDPETARRWTYVPSVVKTELRYPVSPHSYLYFRLGLHRDIAAWYQDPIGLNLPLNDREVDLNEPSLGYFHAENEAFAFTVGRFPVHWSPSPDFGLALSDAVPYHNAAEFALKMPHVRYRFLASSLNPWLQGTPPGDSSGENYPVGSEEYLQRHYADKNGARVFHKRVYAERIKTLFAHRLEGELGPLGLGITEAQVIGGKVPDFRDAGPFVFFHNDFKDGYTNGALSLDASLRLPAGFSLAGELYMDDVQYADTEGEGNTASLLGYLIGLRHALAAGGWVFSQSLYAIRTDPFLYGYPLPMNTMASRHILASNYGDPDESPLVERYVVDYPLGYLRGGDTFDFWYEMDAWKGPRLRFSAQAAILAKGGIDLATPYQDYYSSPHDSPTGTVEREVRLGLEAGYSWRYGLACHAGAWWQHLRNENHVPGKDAERAQVSAGVRWSVGG